MDEHPDDAAARHDEAFSQAGQTAPRDRNQLHRENIDMEAAHERYRMELAEEAALERDYLETLNAAPPALSACPVCHREGCFRCAADDARIFADDRPEPRYSPGFPSEAA